jgi:O-antigen ligase
MVFSVYFVWELTRKKNERNAFLDSFCLLLSLVALIGSGSRTSTLGFLLGVGTLFFVMYLRRRVNVQDIGMTLGYSLVAGIVFLLLLEQLFLTESLTGWLVDLLGRDLTFTGRTELWADLWKVGISRPFLGHGFGGLWVPDNPVLADFWKEHTWHPMTAHNGYLAVFLETGLLGLITVFLVILNTYKKISRSLATHFDLESLGIAVLLMLILHNFSETTLGSLNDPLWVMFLFMSVSAGSPVRLCGRNSVRPTQGPQAEPPVDSLNTSNKP